MTYGSNWWSLDQYLQPLRNLSVGLNGALQLLGPRLGALIRVDENPSQNGSRMIHMSFEDHSPAMQHPRELGNGVGQEAYHAVGDSSQVSLVEQLPGSIALALVLMVILPLQPTGYDCLYLNDLALVSVELLACLAQR